MSAVRRKRTNVKPGDRFGKLTVLGFSHYLNSHKVFSVRCECGTEKTVTGTHMVQGNTVSCGCYWKSIISKEPGAMGLKRLFNQYVSNARTRSYSFEISFEQFKEIVVLDCDYCGEPARLQNPYLKSDGTPSYGNEKVNPDRAWVSANGVDRRDNEPFYRMENSVPCCARCNEMKMDNTKQEFLEQNAKIYLRKIR